MAGGTKRRRSSVNPTASSTTTTKEGGTAKRQAKKTPPTTTATTRSHGSSPPTQNYVWTIHQKLLELSSTTAVATTTFQALADLKLTGPGAGSSTTTTSTTASTTATSTTTTTTTPSVSANAGYWMIVATSVVQRLIQEGNDYATPTTTTATTTTTRTAATPTTTTSTVDHALVLAALCETLSRIVTSERSKLEKALQATTSRATVARALLVPTMGAVQCLSNLLLGEGGGDDSLEHIPVLGDDAALHFHSTILVGATAALDRLIHVQPQMTNGMAGIVLDWQAPQMVTIAKHLEEVCATVSTDAMENQVVQSLLAADSGGGGAAAAGGGGDHDTTTATTNTSMILVSSSPVSPSKRGGRTRSQSGTSVMTAAAATTPTSSTSTTTPDATTTPTSGAAGTNELPPSELLPLITDLLGPLVEQRIDARVAVKRWSSMALVWYNQAPLNLLKMVHKLGVSMDYFDDDEDDGINMFPLKLSVSNRSQIMYRLLAVVAESGVASGFRPPTGAMDQYLTQLAKSRDSARVDIRDWTVVAIYDMIQVHRQCLTLWTTTGSRDGMMIVNDDETHNHVFTAPDLSVVLACLCRSASLSVASAGYSQQSEWTRALNAIAASFCLQLANEDSTTTMLPLDARLCTWAIGHLTNLLRQLQEQAPSATTPTPGVMATDKDVAMEQHHQLSVEIPKPIVPETEDSSIRLGDGTKKTTYASVWTVRPTFSNEDALAITLRGLISEGVENVRMQLFTFLTDVIRRSYGSRKISLEEQHLIDDSKPKTKGGRKRGAKSTAGGRTSKQRKTAKDQAPSNAHEDGGYQRISVARANLAREALTAIRYALTSRRGPTFGLVATIRNEMTLSQVQDLIGLGDLLDKVLMETRVGDSQMTIRDPPPVESTSDNAVPMNSSIIGSGFAGHEKTLWSAHITMSQVLARGHDEYDGEPRVLFNETTRKAIFESIAGSKGSPWPLALPCAHHAFLIANITSMSTGPEQSTPEQFLVKQLLKATKERLQNLHDIEGIAEPFSNSLYDEPRPLISYHDAVVAILAYSRLPCEAQRKAFEDLIGAIHSSLQKLESDSLTLSMEAWNFLARTVVLSCAMMSILTYGQPLRQVLFAAFGPLQVLLPERNSNPSNQSNRPCFMGLLGDAESPGLPDFDKLSLVTPMKDNVLHQMQSLLEATFRIGIQVAQTDHGYLLFVSWNGLGKLYTEAGAEKFKPSDTIALQINPDDYPRRILQMRDDVCLIQSEIQRIAAGQRTLATVRFRSNLKSTLHRANILMGRVLDDAVGKTEVDASLLVLLASIPAYVASSIAAHTKPGNDYFSNALARGGSPSRIRGYSSESDRINSDIDSSVDTDAVDHDASVADAIARLRDCCDAFGAAPTHPDWIDVSCSFQEGVRCSDVIDNAETALRLLNKLARTAFEQYQKNLLESLKMYKIGDTHAKEEELKLCLDLLYLSSHEELDDSPLGLGSYFDDRDWKDDIAVLCDLPSGLLDLMMDDTLLKHAVTTRDSFAQNAGHRLRGRLQDKKRPFGGWEFSAPELRAAGEWDILLAEALATASLDVKRYSRPATRMESEDRQTNPTITRDTTSSNLTEAMLENGYHYLKQARMWHTIMSNAVNNMPPAASLLRMGVNQVGRSPHPYSFRENCDDPWDAVPISFAEELANAFSSDLVASTARDVLATTSSVSARDEPLSAACRAVAAQLVVDTKSFEDMESLQAIRLALNGLRSVVDHSGKVLGRSSSIEVLPYILERILLMVEDCGRKGVDAEDAYGILRTMFRLNGHTVKTITATPVDFLSILKFDETSTTVWIKTQNIEKALGHLVAVICGSPVNATDRSRAAACLLLEKLISAEWYQSQEGQESGTQRLLILVSRAFEAIPKIRLKDALLCDLCDVGRTESILGLHRRSFSRLLLFILGGHQKFKYARYVHDTLVGSLSSWARSGLPTSEKSGESAMHVLLTLGCQFNSLTLIGSRMLGVESAGKADASGSGLDFVATFFEFIKNLTESLDLDHASPPSLVQAESTDSRNNNQGPSPGSLARRCSFVEKTGYHGQHWYNCYTCGLVWEKGCCTLCALVCHSGHDISYSRYSSFFCDCAAEDGAVNTQSRVSCQCMVALTTSKVKELERNQMAEINVEIEKTEKASKDEPTGPKYAYLSIEIAVTRYGDESQQAIRDLPKSLSKKVWFDAIIKLLHDASEKWRTAKISAPILQPFVDVHDSSRSVSTHRIPLEMLRSLLRQRDEKPLEVSSLQGPGLIPIHSAKGFQTKMSTDSSSNAQLIARLGRHDLSRCNLAADSRGRLIVAEPCSLLFCSTIPAIATRYANKSIESSLSREHMCILGNVAIPFNVVGMKLCPENERHLVVWSFSEACVVVISPNWDGVEKKFDLSLDLEPEDGDADHLVKCEFVPGSQTSVVAGHGHHVRVYDITRCGDNRASAIVAFNLGFETALKDLAFVSLSERPWSASRPPETEAKMFMLLENGKLHSINLKINSEGQVDSPLGQPCELSESVPLPLSGVMPRSGSTLGASGTTSKSFGEGSNIVYLKQSRVLLYKCVSSCVLALMLDASGNVEGAFELLPNILSSEMLSHDEDGHSVVGPYNHWTELGPCYREDGTFFRIACVGRSSRTNQPSLICVDFNQSDVRVKAITRALPTAFGLSHSFDGICSFSMPFVGDDSRERRAFGERSFLCVSTSSGTIMFFGEDKVDVVSERSTNLELVSLERQTAQQAEQPKFPLTIFEHLKNVSECEELYFCGEGTGCDSAELKSKLLRDRSSSFVCDRREGCTISIALRPPSENTAKTKTPSVAGNEFENLAITHAIVAVRILVGSTPGNIPSRVIVQGRPIELSPRVKKWYSLPLTNEEIVLGVRSGFVTLGIGPPSDVTSNSGIDAVEVYARDRKDLSPWIQKFYFASGNDGKNEPDKGQAAIFDKSTRHVDDPSSRGLLLGAKALASFCVLSPESVEHMDMDQRRCIQSIVEETAHTPDAGVIQVIQELLCRLEPDDGRRGLLFDESVLQGWMRALVDVRMALPESPWVGAEGKARWAAVRRFLVNCLGTVSRIARVRPMIYLRCMDVFGITNASAGSIGLQVLQYVYDACRMSLPCIELIDGPSGIVSLCLTEAVIRLNTERGRYLAGFDDIQTLLEICTPDLIRSACDALSGFCRRAGNADEDEANIFRTLQGARLVAYQCDSCGVCPMTDVRYTCLEESFDIDLCHACFLRAKTFAQAHDFNGTIDILIDERAIGTDTRLTCADVERMEAVPVEKMDVAQLDPFSNSALNDNGEQPNDVPPSTDERRSETNKPLIQTEAQPYDDFISFFFSGMVSLLSAHLMKGERNHLLAPILRVCLDLIRDSTNTEMKDDHARQLAKEMTRGITCVLRSRQSNDESVSDEPLWSIISCIRAAQLLLIPKEADYASVLENFHCEDDPKSNMNSDVRCDAHHIPAVRRRSAKGKNKDRRFYVCGKERGQRCTFFKWADELDIRPKTKMKISSQLKNVVLENFWDERLKDATPLNVTLCTFLEGEIFENRDSVESSFDHPAHRQDKKMPSSRLASRYDDASRQRDADDGVLCSREKLQDAFRGFDLTVERSDKHGLRLDPFGTGDTKKYLLEASLDLLALIADYTTPGITRWFSLLCEIENSSSFVESRGLARKVLQSLCGKKRTLFHAVRDHFSFGFQFQALFRNAAPLLETALLVSERARVCGADWTATSTLDWHSLPYGGLIGSNSLISDNDYPEPRLWSIGKILDDILAVVRNGCESWRRFCGHATLPPLHRDPKRTSPDVVFAEKMTVIPPIAVLFWVACSLSGDSQVKAFRLIDMALTKSTGGLGTAPMEIEGQSDAQADTALMLTISDSASNTPESVLLSSTKQLSVDSMAKFVHHFVLDGASSDLRRACHMFTSKIAATMSRSDRTELFTKLLSSRFLGVGQYGKSSTEFLSLLQCLTPDLDPSLSFEEYGDLMLFSFINQMEAVKYDRYNEQWAVIESTPLHSPTVKKKLELAECIHCFRTQPTTMHRDKNEDSTAMTLPGHSKRSGITRASRQAKKWRPEQVSGFSRQRMDSIRAGSSSNEFNTFYLLKHRVVVGDILLAVSDPRGRFVKGVTIYYSPHPAKDAAELKMDEYAPKWQKCATMVLPRGASRASITLAYSIVAANLRIEFTDFYERPGGSKASDGSILVHCPRCTRVVTNAHGVCGNCGEVAFQCRKCRHINYDRLDAFLCVECGYCASGSFSLEINAAVASNAIAIVSDKEHARAMKILGAVNTLHGVVKAVLMEKIKEIDKQSKESAHTLARDGTFDTNLDLALLGLPHLVEAGKASKSTGSAFMDRIDKPGSLVRMAARPESLQDSGRSAAPGDRTQSLLRLARQIRSESGMAWDRRRSGDLLIRHLGRGIAVDTVEGQRNLIGLLEDGNVLDSADTLGRAIAGARASARGDRLAPTGSPGRPSEGAPGDASSLEHHARKGKKLSVKETLDECQRLHSFMREAQKERYEIKRRIHAWEKLNEGSLVDIGHPLGDDDEIDKCHCSACGPAVAFNLLNLWAHLFAARPRQVRVDVDFLSMLLTDSAQVGKTLADRMRDTVTNIATESEDGARLVLSQIRRRLLATSDPVSAEILGKIMGVEGHFLGDEYAKLAMDLLSQRQG